jgi:aminoglycoside 3'-phosphotransferase-1
LGDTAEHGIAAEPPVLPTSLASQTIGYSWARDTVGMSGAAVYRLWGKNNEPDLYLKHARGGVAEDVAEEAAKLRWLQGRLPVPLLRATFAAPDETWLLTEAVPGRPAWQVMKEHPAQHPAIVDALAGFLRRLHALPAAQCPFDSSAPVRLAEARWRIDHGLVDEARFDEARHGWTAQQVWDAMIALQPLPANPVVTHGDFSLENVLVDRGVVTGCIDLDRLGVADRYQDVAILWNSLDEFGPKFQRQFLRAYGIAEPDKRSLDFYLMLDELF